METTGEKLKDYVAKNTAFWIWEHDIWHEVIYLGWESVIFMPKSPNPTSTIRYHFKQANGETKPIDVRSPVFANLMSGYDAGAHLKIKRTKINARKFEYQVEYNY